MKIKLSLGSAIMLGLVDGKIAVPQQTLYLMLGKQCIANCKFCAQAISSKADKKFLSRVTWPEFELEKLLEKLQINKAVKRLCIQTLRYPALLQDLIYLIKELRYRSNILISACVNPLNRQELLKLREAGVSNVGIGLDCATEELFYKLKPGAGGWEEYIIGIKDAIDIFGATTVHLIAGVGESDFDLINTIWKLNDLGAVVALFSYTPLEGIKLKLGWPEVKRYRAIQLARWLITNNIAKLDDFKFEKGKLVRISIEKEVIERKISSGKPFQTSGCSYCTRPFYNERVMGPLYNYPKELSKNEIVAAKEDLKDYGVFS
ncbi:MAG: radical SAM protein [Candidatus Thermoplasmatota archaeon]|nr:radical SAM protein [Candidatus Thermoplasmatota archaeon]